jgi:hypothetical protein
MRKAIMFIVGLVAVALISTEAGAVKLTQEQVNTVCGKGLETSSHGSGCTKACGVNNEHVCDFSCTKKFGCNGHCVSCRTGSRETTSGPVVRAKLALPTINRSTVGLPTYCQWCYASCPRWNFLCKIHCRSRGQCPPLNESRVATR